MPGVSQHSQSPNQVANNSMLMQSQETHYPLVYIGTCTNIMYINTSMHPYMHLKEVIFENYICYIILLIDIGIYVFWKKYKMREH